MLFGHPNGHLSPSILIFTRSVVLKPAQGPARLDLSLLYVLMPYHRVLCASVWGDWDVPESGPAHEKEQL